MRKSNFYGVDVPELGDRADITVVSQAIIDGEDNQSGRIEHLEATNSGTTLILSSETRADKLIKYYNGLSIQFVSPVNITAGNSYKIKIDNLAEQPYNNKTDIKAGDIVQAYYGASGFVSSNTPIPRSSSTSSSSEITVATSLAVKNANDNANTRALKTTQIIAGNGLIGGGALDANRTINVASADDSITVGADNIKVNTYNGVDGTSTTRPASANAVKQANDNANTRALKTVQVVAGKGLTGGGDMSTNRTIDVVSKNDGIIVNDNDIQLNVYDGVDSSSTTRAGSARAIKMAYDKGVEGLNKAGEKVSKSGDIMAGKLGFQKDNYIYFGGDPKDNSWGKIEYNNTVAFSHGSDYVLFGMDMSVANSGFGHVTFGDDGEEYFVFRLQKSRPAGSDPTYEELLKIARNSLTFRGSGILTESSNLFLGNAGITGIVYIQDVGQKVAGNGYIDKTTGKLYLCINTNSDTSVTSNFILASNVENAKKTQKRYLVDKGETNGVYWEIYSDNWCIQMSKTPIFITADPIIFTMPKSYKDTNYNLIVSSTTNYGKALAYFISSANSFRLDYNDNNTGNVYFMAQGYIA